jgi:predicted dehydrogenase
MIEKLRLGVAGTGAVVEQIYQWLYYRSAYSSRLSVEAIADPNTKALHKFGDQYSIPKERRFSSHKDMLEAAKAEKFELDVVCVNTPDSFHRAVAVDAIKAGYDVFVPKPLADKVTDAYEMMTLADKMGKIIVVDYHKRDDPRFQEVRGKYLRGYYGKFQTAHLDMLDRLDVAIPGKFFFFTRFRGEKHSSLIPLCPHGRCADVYSRHETSESKSNRV